jgi:hypothetical protein
MIGNLWSYAGRLLHQDATGRRVFVSSCEGPNSEILSGVAGQIVSMRESKEHHSLIIKTDHEVKIEGKAISYFAALPRHTGYDGYALLMIPIAVNLVALQTPESPVEHRNFVAVCSISLAKNHGKRDGD